MGCFPSREGPESYNDDYNELDLDNTPLLPDSSTLQEQEGTESPLKYVVDTMDTRTETLLLKLEHAHNLKTRIVQLHTTAEIDKYRLKLQGLLNSATVEMGRLTREEKYHDAEKVVKAIMQLKSALGDEFFDAAKINAFGREITDLGDFILTGGQYFKPVMMHEDDDSIVKLYFFIISDAETTEILYRYYLEHASFLDEYFGLGLVTRHGHTQVEIYGDFCPPYWKVRQDVINNLKRRLSPVGQTE